MSFASQQDVQSRINTNSPAGKWRTYIFAAISLVIFCKNNPTDAEKTHTSSCEKECRTLSSNVTREIHLYVFASVKETHDRSWKVGKRIKSEVCPVSPPVITTSETRVNLLYRVYHRLSKVACICENKGALQQPFRLRRSGEFKFMMYVPYIRT